MPPIRLLSTALAVLALEVAAAPAQPPEDRAVARALALFDGDGEAAGSLELAARLRLAGESGEEATVEILLPSGESAVRAWVVVPRLDEEPWVRRFEPGMLAAEPGAARLVRADLELPSDFLEAAVVVEEIATGRWGAALAELAEEPMELPPQVTVWEAPGPRAGPAPPTPRAAVIRLLPPREARVTGRIRLRTLVSDLLVLRTTFLVDGQPVASDDEPPFAAEIDLGPQPLPRRIEVVAWGPEGRELGRDTIRVNAADDPFQVRITRVGGDPAEGRIEVEAAVSTPADGELESVAFYYNEELAARRERPPFSAPIAVTDPRPSDYLRVVARLEDGRELEDARLLAAPAERVEVNLVELYAVVTDAAGEPVPDLDSSRFEMRLRGRPQAIERFGPADRVPLVLGLIVDTSQSMEALMPDTKKAGSKFLAEVLRPGDRSFLVDFDTRPRLAHDTTGDVGSLLRSFGSLRPDGYTALYDAVIFSLLQFEGSDGRRALVLLTDGDDYRSRFSQGRAIRYGRELGVPVYILGLAGILDPRAGLRKTDLEGITEGTGGRIFYISSPEELDAAYAAIQAELRNQYLLTFSTDRPLSREEIGSLRVSVAGRGLSVRAVVGGRSID